MKNLNDKVEELGSKFCQLFSWEENSQQHFTALTILHGLKEYILQQVIPGEIISRDDLKKEWEAQGSPGHFSDWVKCWEFMKLQHLKREEEHGKVTDKAGTSVSGEVQGGENIQRDETSHADPTLHGPSGSSV